MWKTFYIDVCVLLNIFLYKNSDTSNRNEEKRLLTSFTRNKSSDCDVLRNFFPRRPRFRIYFDPESFFVHHSPMLFHVTRFAVDCTLRWTSAGERRGYARLENITARREWRGSFTAALPRRISCGCNRAGHSRDCVGVGFLSFPLSIPSSPDRGRPRERNHLLLLFDTRARFSFSLR